MFFVSFVASHEPNMALPASQCRLYKDCNGAYINDATKHIFLRYEIINICSNGYMRSVLW